VITKLISNIIDSGVTCQ